jgi:hypothetical protein
MFLLIAVNIALGIGRVKPGRRQMVRRACQFEKLEVPKNHQAYGFQVSTPII